MKRKTLVFVLVCAGVVSAGAAGAVAWNPSEWFHHESAQTNAVATPSASSSVTGISPIGAPNFRAIVERYGSAVVGINTQGMAKTTMNNMPDGFQDDPFFRFFKELPGFNGDVPRGQIPLRGQGSGFIVSKDGLILTNAHVVRDANEVIVKLSDRREYKAKVLGSDRATDVAVLKINAKNLPVVSFGNPNQLGVGDYVLAIGSPFGFEQSATAGIVSAKGRSLPGDGYVPFIQTDVAVNPGNSGGPLFDVNGAVVGINSQIYSQTGGYQGVSFAIPIDVALHVKDQIVNTGKVVHGRLGVTIQELDQTLAESFKLEQPDGALVSSVLPDSSAAKAGLKPGDVILKYNGQPIARSGDLPALVGLGKPGDKVLLEVWRSGKKLTISANLGEATEVVAANDSVQGSRAHGKLGILARPLTSDEKREIGAASGVVVERVSGPAAWAGVEAGDVIVSVNGKQVGSVEELQSLVSEDSKHIALLVQRGDEKIFIPVTLG